MCRFTKQQMQILYYLRLFLFSVFLSGQRNPLLAIHISELLSKPLHPHIQYILYNYKYFFSITNYIFPLIFQFTLSKFSIFTSISFFVKNAVNIVPNPFKAKLPPIYIFIIDDIVLSLAVTNK